MNPASLLASQCSAVPSRPWPRLRGEARHIAALLLVAAVLLPALLLGGCNNRGESLLLMRKAQSLWEAGQYEDAARHFVTVSELLPQTPMAEEALFWAANLYQHFLQKPDQAIRHYQQLIVDYPGGRYFYDAKENLAVVYEQDPQSGHRALQIYQQLMLAEPLADRRNDFRFRIGNINLKLNRMDQARLSFRDLMAGDADATSKAEAEYLVGYSYFLEKRYDLALLVFRRTAESYPDGPVAPRARYFVADTLEEQGQMREALKAFERLRGKYPNQELVERRIDRLKARIRRGVR